MSFFQTLVPAVTPFHDQMARQYLPLLRMIIIIVKSKSVDFEIGWRLDVCPVRRCSSKRQPFNSGVLRVKGNMYKVAEYYQYTKVERIS